MAIVDIETAERRSNDSIIVGKDILELLSSAMYVDPLTIYREFVQNAADSIDEAGRQGLFTGKEQPRIDISLDHETRSAKIRDNGTGIAARWVRRRLTSVGASKKRGTTARGFRGVGRLSGLAYCRQMIFRSKSSNDENVYEMSWDCQKLRELLSYDEKEMDLHSTMEQIISTKPVPAAGYPDRFFEVELSEIHQHKSHLLLNEDAITRYLSQVAPVPFSQKFALGKEIQNFLESFGVGKIYNIFVQGAEKPINRPFHVEFEARKGLKNSSAQLETFEIPGISDGVDAIAWILHHDYLGAIPDSIGIKGLRARLGNIQIGSPSTLDAVFKEPRFNSWTIGEVHILNPKIIPNGRRDDFEQNGRYNNLTNHLKPKALMISQKCRSLSAKRTKDKQSRGLVVLQGIDWPTLKNSITKLGAKKLTKPKKHALRNFIQQKSVTYADTLSFLLQQRSKTK